MSWDVARARRSNRRWAAFGVGLWLVPALLLAGVWTMPYWWSARAWAQQQADAVSIRDYDALPADASVDDVIAKLGAPLMSGPGFETGGVKQGGVYYWRADAGEVRGLVVNDRVVGRLKVGRWR